MLVGLFELALVSVYFESLYFEQLAVKKAIKFLRSPFFFKPAKTILVPGTSFFGLVSHWSRVSSFQTTPESR